MPPPPPAMTLPSVNSGGLSAALKNAQLRKVSKPDENAVNYAAVTGTIGRGGVPTFPGSEDIMSEMARKLRERRARADGSVSSEPETAAGSGTSSGGTNSDKKTPSDKGLANGAKAMAGGSESPKSRSKRFQSLTGQESSGASVLSTDLTASLSDLEAVKQELLAEIRKEIHQAKQEIIDAIKSHINRQ